MSQTVHSSIPNVATTRRGLLLTLAVGVVMATGACGGSSPSGSGGQSANQLLAAGLQAQQAGQYSVALADYDKVLQLDPKNKYAYYDLGLIYQEQGDEAKAEADYRSALGIDPNFANAIFNLAILRTGPAPQEALELYQHAIQLSPDWPEAHLNLGFLLIQLGQKSQGKAELALAVRLKPDMLARVPKDLLPLPSPTP